MEYDDETVHKILKQFPFYRRNKDRQIKVLSDYLVKGLGLTQTETAEELEVNRETVKKIQEAWKHLDSTEQIVLIGFLREKFLQMNSEVSEKDVLPDNC